MNLYEIDNEILKCIDGDTGEIIDIAKLNALQFERDSKIESVALWIKNLIADTEAYKKEKEAFTKREQQSKRKIEVLKKYLTDALNGSTFITNKVEIKFRESERIELDDTVIVPQEYIVSKITEVVDKNALKKAIKSGSEFEGCHLVRQQNIQIR